MLWREPFWLLMIFPTGTLIIPATKSSLLKPILRPSRARSQQRVRIINLCSSYRYLSDGYYCSLLAEARGHHVIPSVKVLNDLGKKSLYRLQLEDLSETLARAFKTADKDSEITLMSYFGTTPDPAFQELARLLFERFSCPILEVTLRCMQAMGNHRLKGRIAPAPG